MVIDLPKNCFYALETITFIRTIYSTTPANHPGYSPDRFLDTRAKPRVSPMTLATILATTSAKTSGETNYSLIFDIRALARVSRDGSIYTAPEIIAEVLADHLNSLLLYYV